MAPAPRRAPRRGGAQSPRARQGRGVSNGGGEYYEEEYVPRKRSVKMHPVAGLFLFGSPVVLFIFVVYLYINKPEPTTVENEVVVGADDEYKKFKSKMTKARGLYAEAISLRDSEDAEKFKTKLEEAKDFVGSLLDELDAMLEPLGGVDAELTDEYGEYARDYGQLQTWMLDLIKTSGF